MQAEKIVKFTEEAFEQSLKPVRIVRKGTKGEVKPVTNK